MYEIAKTANGYASTPTILYSFCPQATQALCTDGASLYASLIADANGNLFGITIGGGAFSNCSGGCGTVFEIAKTAGGYASAPTTLVRFDGTDGAFPEGSLIADANGNLFGTTRYGGNSTNCPNSPNSPNPVGCGTVYEIAKTASGYANTPTTLYSFCSQASCTDGAFPEGGLIADANGKLFGTTPVGGAYGYGTVFVLQTFAGLPGRPNCIGTSVSALAQKYGGLLGAAAALGYPNVAALQAAIMAFCDGSEQVASTLP